ncbi:MAG: glycosyltransferase family 2 protein [Gammaproteobacteria bacterium]|nr:glycosyltransferase family 2 protein [Gammaproteobacteria bacterium]MBU1653664.1 glycosyltransferase family 2 protein [Gammaproteobacteria bacterium]MBU1962494.1 glycosyltransferase family 2 protein [Gammaproteobacteria bacterium]
MNRQPLSAVIITLNEARRLSGCLDSLDFVDEILVVDSGSTDGTQALAESRGCRVIHQPWLGYGPQKNFAVTQAANDWVLCIDADEWVSEPLRQSILHTLADPRFQIYQMPRCNKFMGRWLRHGEGYPDWSPRLFNRNHAQWSLDPVHEKVETSRQGGELTGDLMHESEETLEQYLDKQNRYTSLQARALFEKGKRAGLDKLLLSPLLRFLKMYLLRMGFRDGVPGLVHIASGCFNSHMKYAKLRALYLKHVKSSEVEAAQ